MSGTQMLRTASRLIVITLVIVVGAFLLADRLLAASHSASTARPSSDSTIGRLAPDFTITAWNDTSGSGTIHLAALRGHPVVVNFWAPWCAPCQDEMPMLAAASHTYAARGVRFVGVAFDTQRADAVSFLQKQGITYPCGPDATGSIASAYALPGIPVTIFIDRRGIVVQRVTGPLTSASLQKALQAALR